MNETLSTLKRRGFLRRAGAGLAGIGAFAGGGAVAAAQAPGGAAWEPAVHAEDAWLDRGAKHRLFLDSVSPNGFGTALLYANNFFNANRSGYALTDQDLGVAICARHNSTPFAFNDAMWAKYGGPMSESADFTDPKTKAAAKVNVYQASGYGGDLTSMGTTIDSLVGKGAQFAVCQLATRRIASLVAKATGQTVDAVLAELTSNLVGSAHMVPAGIVAVGRAQEHGYGFAYGG